MRTHKLAWVLTFSIVLTSGAAVAYLAQRNSTAEVGKVQVVGVDTQLAAKILKVAAISKGEQITELDQDAAAGRVLSLPDIRSVKFDRKWNNNFVISVELRDPIGWYKYKDQLNYIDSDGSTYISNAEQPDLELIVFSALSNRAREYSVTAFFDLPPKVANKVVQANARSSSNIRFILKDGVEVVWGDIERPERKAEVLEVLMQRTAKLYDVSAPDLPIIRIS